MNEREDLQDLPDTVAEHIVKQVFAADWAKEYQRALTPNKVRVRPAMGDTDPVQALRKLQEPSRYGLFLREVNDDMIKQGAKEFLQLFQGKRSPEVLGSKKGEVDEAIVKLASTFLHARYGADLEAGKVVIEDLKKRLEMVRRLPLEEARDMRRREFLRHIADIPASRVTSVTWPTGGSKRSSSGSTVPSFSSSDDAFDPPPAAAATLVVTVAKVRDALEDVFQWCESSLDDRTDRSFVKEIEPLLDDLEEHIQSHSRDPSVETSSSSYVSRLLSLLQQAEDLYWYRHLLQLRRDLEALAIERQERERLRLRELERQRVEEEELQRRRELRV